MNDAPEFRLKHRWGGPDAVDWRDESMDEWGLSLQTSSSAIPRIGKPSGVKSVGLSAISRKGTA